MQLPPNMFIRSWMHSFGLNSKALILYAYIFHSLDNGVFKRSVAETSEALKTEPKVIAEALSTLKAHSLIFHHFYSINNTIKRNDFTIAFFI